MAESGNIYFVSDVHLGLKVGDAAEREARFVDFLKGVPRDTTGAVCLLGDIWDFWYEYRDVVPREGARVVSELIQLMDDGVEVWFCPGNHDIWTFNFFESLGMRIIAQPCFVSVDGVEFCLGHGDGLGGARWSYSFMQKIFHNRVAQKMFSVLHPWLAYRLGLGWSDSNRHSRKPYRFRGEDEPLYRFAVQTAAERRVDWFVFGHFHDGVKMTLESGAGFVVLKDWMDGGTPYALWNGEEMITSF